MSTTSNAALWAQIATLVAEHERAQTDAIRAAVAQTWQQFRQRLQAVAIESDMPPEAPK